MITLSPPPREAGRDPLYALLVRALPVVHEYVWARLPDRGLADEVTTEILGDLVRLWPFGVPGGDEISVALGLARTRVIDEYGAVSPMSLRRSVALADGGRRRALEALAGLRRRQRQAVLAHYVDGLDEAGIAELLRCRPVVAGRLVRSATARLSVGGDGPAARRAVASLLAGLVGDGDPPEPTPDSRTEVYELYATGRGGVAVAQDRQPTGSQPRSNRVMLGLMLASALAAVTLLFVAPQPQSSREGPPSLVTDRTPRSLSSPQAAVVRPLFAELGAVTIMPVHPNVAPPFEVIAVDAATGSAAAVDFVGGTATFYPPAKSLLPRLSVESLTAHSAGWLTLADGLLWWFDAGVAAPPTLLLEVEPQDVNLRHVIPSATGGDDRVWAVQPGPGYGGLDRPSLVRQLAFADPEDQTITMAPSDVRPVAATSAGLLLNQSDWIELGTRHVEDPASRKMMVVTPAGDLVPLWPGLGIDFRTDRLVWADCLPTGENCRIVVSQVTRVEDEYVRGADRLIGDSAVSLQPVDQPGVASVSPDGSRLIAQQSFTDGRTDLSLVLVDLLSGSVSEPLAAAPDAARRGPTAVWSRDGDWVVLVDDRPSAIRVSDRLEVDLWDWIPSGMQIRAVAAR